MKAEYLTTSSAARRLERSAELVRFYARNGRLPAIVTESGQRIFLAEDVERLSRELKERRAK